MSSISSGETSIVVRRATSARIRVVSGSSTVVVRASAATGSFWLPAAIFSSHSVSLGDCFFVRSASSLLSYRAVRLERRCSPSPMPQRNKVLRRAQREPCIVGQVTGGSPARALLFVKIARAVSLVGRRESSSHGLGDTFFEIFRLQAECVARRLARRLHQIVEVAVDRVAQVIDLLG